MKKEKENWEKRFDEQFTTPNGYIADYIDGKELKAADIKLFIAQELLRLKEEIIKKIEKSREKLAELEHKQWESWTRYLVENGWLEMEVVPDLIKRWKKNWKPYSKLSEKDKDADRVWADKVIEELKEGIN